MDYTKIIDINDPVYTFIEVLNHVDLKQYFVEKDYITGRPKYDSEKLLKVVLFAFMESGYVSLRDIEKLCKTDIRFMWILDDMRVQSYATIGNFIKYDLKKSVPEIMNDMNSYIFKKEKVNLNHVYIDGTNLCQKNIVFLVQDFCACFSTNRDDFMLKTKKMEIISTK